MSSQDIDTQSVSLGKYQDNVSERVRQLDALNFVGRFWEKDPTLWGGDSSRQEAVASMLGWVDVLPKIEARLGEIEDFVAGVRADGFERVILAGMGGSSLAPLVFSQCYPLGEGGLPIDVLDSTDPETVLRIARAGNPDKTLVVVASKSGSTAEPSAFDAYFYEAIGKPENFVAITDPGSPFVAVAEKRNFRKIFLNYPDIGGRFSALSLFGMVPAALMGFPLREVLGRALALTPAQSPEADTVAKHPAFTLGAALGELATEGRNKLTFLTTEAYAPLGLWMEQLVAESTGKLGTGILPIAGEAAGEPEVYGDDRIFVVFRPEGQDVDALNATAAALAEAGHPVITIDLSGPYAIAQEMFRFEIATAVVGAILDINPYDQPDVEKSKIITKRILGEVEKDGQLPEIHPDLIQGKVSVYGTHSDSLDHAIQAFLAARAPGDYVAIMAYLPESDELTSELHGLQRTVRDATHLATTMGYGPRFLHSTGQFHKGGPATGFYLQLMGAHAENDSIPGLRASWAQFIDAQAMGDLEALQQVQRRTLRIDLGSHLVVALRDLQEIVAQALG